VNNLKALRLSEPMVKTKRLPAGDPCEFNESENLSSPHRIAVEKRQSEVKYGARPVSEIFLIARLLFKSSRWKLCKENFLEIVVIYQPNRIMDKSNQLHSGMLTWCEDH
jgi:hypothetical protein